MPRKNHKKYENKKRTQVSKSLKIQIQRLHEQGHKPAKIKEKLKLGDMPRQTFHNCLNYSDKTVHKMRNRTVDNVQEQFEREVTLLYRQRARSRGFGLDFVTLFCREVREKNQSYRDNEKIAEMKFSTNYIVHVCVLRVREGEKCSKKSFR